MINFRRLIPDFLVNYGKHLPEAVMANFLYGFPSSTLRVIGVTGTDGKTTTVNMIYRILKEAKKKVSMVSTIGAEVGGRIYDTGFHVTTPPSFNIQKYLELAKDHGDKFVVLEATSHALSQFRVWGVRFEVGIITNVTHEHLDYHRSFETYLETKSKLIRDVKWAVLNYDDPNFGKLSQKTLGRVVSFGLSNRADFNPSSFSLHLKLPGDFNMLNALAAAAASSLVGVDREIIKKALESFTTLSGRMEEIKNSRGIKIVVDFAHTPNGLEQALKTLKIQNKGRLIAVFGAAGERDKDKRPMMGRVAASLADMVIVTDEDPRFEDRNEIIEEIAQGVKVGGGVEGKTFLKEPDRFKAIEMALKLAKRGDTVGIFGKGHEKSMSYQGVEKSWSDKEAVLKVLGDG